MLYQLNTTTNYLADKSNYKLILTKNLKRYVRLYFSNRVPRNNFTGHGSWPIHKLDQLKGQEWANHLAKPSEDIPIEDDAVIPL